MKKNLLSFLLFTGVAVSAQKTYWQQELKYNITASLNDKDKIISGSESIMYKNNSPETLNFIWFHLIKIIKE